MEIVRKKGFRQQFMALRPYMKLQLGLRFFVLAMAAIMLNGAMAVAATVTPFVVYGADKLGIRISFDKDGLSGDELALVEKLERRAKEFTIPEPKQEVTMAQIRAAFPGFFNDDGKPKVAIDEMVEALSDTDKGIRSILKKQGEDLLALKNKLAENGGSGLSMRSVLDKSWDGIDKVIKNGQGEFVLNLRAPAVMTLANTITGDDLLPDDLIESFSVGAFVPKRYPREYVFDIASRTTKAKISQYKTWLEEGSEQGAFAEVAEGGLKPLVSYDLVRNFSEYKKVAAKYVVTEELTKFRQEAWSIIQRLVNQKLLRDYAAILTTNLLSAAASYVSSALDDQYEDPTDYHAIAAVAAQIEALDFMPDVLILNPQDKWRIGMLQGTDGQFILQIPVTDPSGTTRIMGFSVRTSNRIAVGNFILGESGLWEIEDEALTIRMGYGVSITKNGENVTDVQHDLDHNRFRVIVETFFHNYIASNNEGSFVYANFAAVKEALQSI